MLTTSLIFLRPEYASLFAVCVGRNFKFGKEKDGDSQLLAKKGGNSGIKIEIIDSKIMDGQAISSSRIRIALCSGKIIELNKNARTKLYDRRTGKDRQRNRSKVWISFEFDWDPESRPAYGVTWISL